MKRLLSRARLGDGEAGMTLVEMLVAAAMSVVIVGGAGSMLISSVRNQPKLTKRSQDVANVRWILERMTREIRNGIVVDRATASEVSFKTQVRHTVCGGSVVMEPQESSRECEVTYRCDATSCSRIEASPGIYEGPATKMFGGINSSKVFNYSPGEEHPTFIGITLSLANPGGTGNLSISDGAALRSASLLVE